MLLGRALFGERPGQHELRLEYGSGFCDHAVESRTHPAENRMPNPALDVPQRLPRIALEPLPIEGFGGDPQLNDEIAGQVFWFDFAPLFPPEPDQRGLILAHDNPGIRAADVSASRLWKRNVTHRFCTSWPV